jgi:hypothetical protein
MVMPHCKAQYGQCVATPTCGSAVSVMPYLLSLGDCPEGKEGVLPENARMFQAFDIADGLPEVCGEKSLITTVR